MTDCQFCDSPNVERIGHEWFCNTCGRAWLAFTRQDARFLEVMKVSADAAPHTDPVCDLSPL